MARYRIVEKNGTYRIQYRWPFGIWHFYPLKEFKSVKEAEDAIKDQYVKWKPIKEIKI